MEIRMATMADSKNILEIYRPYIEETAISFEYEVPGLDEFEERVSGILKNYPYLVAEEDGKILGYSYATRFKVRKAYDHVVEASIYVDRQAKGRGIGRALYTELEKYLLKQNVFVLYACITETDRKDDEHLTDDSIKFHERMGYREIGRHKNSGYKFGKWYGIIWMEKVIGDRPDVPEPFIPISEME